MVKIKKVHQEIPDQYKKWIDKPVLFSSDLDNDLRELDQNDYLTLYPASATFDGKKISPPMITKCKIFF